MSDPTPPQRRRQHVEPEPVVPVDIKLERARQKLTLQWSDGHRSELDAATLRPLYADNAAYIEALNASTDEAVANGFLLPADAKLIKDYAAASDIFAPAP